MQRGDHRGDAATRQGDFAFPAARRVGRFSNMALLMVLRRMDRQRSDGHGFRQLSAIGR